jgi:hypothetical protein
LGSGGKKDDEVEMKWSEEMFMWELEKKDVERYRTYLKIWSNKLGIPPPKLEIDERLPFDAVYKFDERKIVLQKFWTSRSEPLKSLKHEFHHHLAELGLVPLIEREGEMTKILKQLIGC